MAAPINFFTSSSNTNTSSSPLAAAAEEAALDADLVLPTVVAYQATLPEMQALPDGQLSTVNIDIMAAIITATGALPEIQGMRPEIVTSLPNFDIEQFDKLGQYTLALTHAHSRYRKAFEPKEDIKALGNELDVVRDDMMANAASLARMRLINGEQLSSLKTIPGYRALASDVLTLCSMFSDDWSKVQGKTPFTKADLHRIGTLALQLISAVGLREQGPVTTGEASLQRQRAFTLFLRAYDQARRAVHYLRNDIGDAEDIAPSLYLNRTRRRLDGVQEEEAAGSSPVAPGVSQAPNAKSPAANPALTISNPASFPVTEGPFTS